MSKTKTQDMEQIFFVRGIPAPEALPNELIGTCMQAALEGSTGKSLLQYGQSKGYLPLRHMLAEQYNVSEDQVLLGNGSLHVLDLLAELLIHPGDVVLIEQPSYDRAITVFRRHGATVMGVPLEHDGINIQMLEEAVKRKKPAFVYIIPDFQNPTGISTSLAKRKALVELAERYDFWLIEDVPYHALRYSGESLPWLRDISSKKVLTLNSYSKLIAPAIRVGYLLAPAHFVAHMYRSLEDSVLMLVIPAQAAVVEFHTRGYFLSHLADLKQLYAERLRFMVALLKRYLPNIPFVEPEGGFFTSISLPIEYDCMNLLTRAQQAGLLLSDGRGFFADPLDAVQGEAQTGERFIRLPFCALPPAQLEDGIQRLANLLKV